MTETRNQVKAEALREAAEDFRRAADSGVEPALNLTAAKLLFQRAAKIEADDTRRVVGEYGGAVPPNAEERAAVRKLLSGPSEAVKEHPRDGGKTDES